MKKLINLLIVIPLCIFSLISIFDIVEGTYKTTKVGLAWFFISYYLFMAIFYSFKVILRSKGKRLIKISLFIFLTILVIPIVLYEFFVIWGFLHFLNPSIPLFSLD